MPKAKATARSRAREFPDSGLEAKDCLLWCDRCHEEILFDKKDTVTKHVDTKKHRKWTGLFDFKIS